MDLKSELLRERLGLYLRLRGGFTFPLAGALYWSALAVLGASLPLKTWIIVAFIGSGLIFPLALLLSRIFRVNFMSEQSAVGDIMLPAFIGMLTFWPIAILAFWSAPELVAPTLAIGMAMHWPVVGWTYARTGLYSAHAIVRALAVAALWVLFPDQRLVLIPACVAVIYLATVAFILVDVRMTARGQVGVQPEAR